MDIQGCSALWGTRGISFMRKSINKAEPLLADGLVWYLAGYNRTPRTLCSPLMQDSGCRTISAVVTAWHFPASYSARTISKWQQTLECLKPQNFWEVLSQHCTCSSYSHSFVQVLCNHLPTNILLNAPQALPAGSTPVATAHRFPSSKPPRSPGSHQHCKTR